MVVVAWEETACSPSTQTWIPPVSSGPPKVEGVYEQVLEGDNGVFVGSRPTTLPEPVNRALAKSSMAVATAFQVLGYVGRCSFDFVVVGDPGSEFQVKLTECNGRWGGTSTPMHLVDRVLGRPRPPYWAQDYVHEDLVGISFPEVMDRVGDAIFDPAIGDGSYIFYNVGPLARTGKLDVVALAATPQRAEDLVREDLPRRLGLS